MHHYDYHRPGTLEEAMALRAAVPGARFVAGGTDLLVQMRSRHLPEPPALISLRGIEALRRIDADGVVRIGATATLTDIARHPAVRELFPALVEAILVLGSRQIQNVGTLGGNLCNASPAADAAPPLLVYGARVELHGPRGARELGLAELFEGPGATALRPDEVMTAIVLEPPAPGTRASFLRRGRVRMDLAIASVAVLLEMRGGVCRRARVAAGAVAPVPLRLPAAEARLEGSRLSDQTIAAARSKAMDEISPITDLRSTAAYRRALIGVFLRRAIDHLRSPAGGDRKLATAGGRRPW